MRRASTIVAAALVGAVVAGVAGAARAQTPVQTPPPPSEAGAEIQATKLSKVPKQKKFVEADYPPEARDKGITADVTLLLDITAEGKVDSVAIAEPSATPGMGFEEAATIAAQQFEFEPAEVDGKPIAVQISYRYHFTLKPKAPPPAPDATAPAAPAPSAPTPAAAAPAPKPVVNFGGIVKERGTRLPLAGALVTLFRDDGDKQVGFEAPTDASGAFQFFDLAPGDWKILIEPPGYFPFRTTETVVAGQKTTVTYYVEKGSYNPYDVTVTATRPRKEVSRTVITAAEIDKIPGAAGDPLAVIQNFAGVARPPLLSGLIIVRGSAPEDTRFFADGAEIPLVYHFGGLRSVIPVGLLDSLEFYPGNFSPMYGRATGGIIDIQVKKLQPKKISGYIDVSVLDTGVYLEAPLGDKGGIAIAGRRSYIDVLLNAAVPSNSDVSLITAPRYYDYQLLGNYRPAPGHDLRLFFMGSDDRFEILFKNPADLDSQITGNTFGTSTTFYRGTLTYRFVPGAGFENMAQVSMGKNFFDAAAGQLAFHLDIFSLQLRDTVKRKLAEWASLNIGVDAQWSDTSGFVRLPPPPKEGMPMGNFDLSKSETTQFNGQQYWSPAVFAEFELKPVPGLLIIPGVRADYFRRVKESVVQPRLTARYQVAERVTVKGGVGLFAQEPQFDETDPVFGNPHLKTERAIHYSAGAEYRPRPYLSFDATLFYKDMSRLVSPTKATYTDANGADHPAIYDNNGVGRAYGAEIVIKHEFSHNFSGWAAYTLMRSERRDSGATDYRLFDFDQTHILTVLGSYVLPRNWQVGARFRYVTGNPSTPVLPGGVYNADRDIYDPVYGPVNSTRVPAFHQLDLRVDKRWVFPRWMLDAYIDIQNVYNRANPDGQGGQGYIYNYNFTRSQPQQGLPIVPILGLRADL